MRRRLAARRRREGKAVSARTGDVRRLAKAVALSLLGYAALFSVLAALPPLAFPDDSAPAEGAATEITIALDDVPAPRPIPAAVSLQARESAAKPVDPAVAPPAAAEKSLPAPMTAPEAEPAPTAETAADVSEIAAEEPAPAAPGAEGSAGTALAEGSAGAADRLEAVGRPSELALNLLYTAIERGLRYPVQARRKGIQGKVELEIAVAESGVLDRCEIAASSGSRMLDEAAMKLLAGLFPFAKELGGAFVTRIAIEYRLN